MNPVPLENEISSVIHEDETEPYSVEDVEREINRRHHILRSIRSIDNKYITKVHELNEYLIKTRNNCFIPNERVDRYIGKALETLASAHDEIQRFDEIINHIKISQARYITLMKEYEKNMTR